MSDDGSPASPSAPSPSVPTPAALRRPSTPQTRTATPQAPSPGNPVYGVDSAEPVGMVANVAASPHGGYDVLAEVRLESLEAGGIRLSGPDGPILACSPLPYPL